MLKQWTAEKSDGRAVVTEESRELRKFLEENMLLEILEDLYKTLICNEADSRMDSLSIILYLRLPDCINVLLDRKLYIFIKIIIPCSSFPCD